MTISCKWGYNRYFSPSRTCMLSRKLIELHLFPCYHPSIVRPSIVAIVFQFTVVCPGKSRPRRSHSAGNWEKNREIYIRISKRENVNWTYVRDRKKRLMKSESEAIHCCSTVLLFGEVRTRCCLGWTEYAAACTMLYVMYCRRRKGGKSLRHRSIKQTSSSTSKNGRF